MAAITVRTQFNDEHGQGVSETRPASDLWDALDTYGQEARKLRKRTDRRALVTIVADGKEVRRLEFSDGLITRIDPNPVDIPVLTR